MSPRRPRGFVSGATVGVDVQLGSAEGVVRAGRRFVGRGKGAWVFAVDNGVIRTVQVEVLDRSLDRAGVEGRAARLANRWWWPGPRA